MSRDIGIEIGDIMNTFSGEVKEIAERDAQAVAKECVQKLKSTSPKKTGKYASGWTAKKKGNGYVVYNAKRPSLTHLLENGHPKKNQFGAYGMTPAIPHIKPVEEWANEEYERRLKSDISNA